MRKFVPLLLFTIASSSLAQAGAQALVPGSINGTVRYGGVENVTLFGQPMKLPCKIVAVGIAGNNSARPPGTHIVAWGLTNQSIGPPGGYSIQGLAGGTYTITAICPGFRALPLERQITLRQDQVLVGVDFFVRAR